MPELPEVETVKRQLEKVLVGQKIEKVRVLLKKSLQGPTLKVEGRKIKEVGRRAKILVIALHSQGKSCNENQSLNGIRHSEIDSTLVTLGNENINILIHLKMTGQLVYVPGGIRPLNLARDLESKGYSPPTAINSRIAGGHPTSDWVDKLPSKHTRVIFELSDGVLYFNDMRTFGWVKVVDDVGKKLEFDKYGPDANSRGFNLKYFKKILGSSNRSVKLIILDQKKVAGLGNIYANDGLNCSGVDPRRLGVELVKDEEKVERLFKCLKKVIKKGIKMGGASERDFVHADGLGGSYQKHYLVYGREGEKCKQCQGIIEKIKIGGRGSYFCSQCQE